MRLIHVTPAYLPAHGGIETVVEELRRQARAAWIAADVAHVSTEWTALRREPHDGSTIWRVPLKGHRLIGLAPALKEILPGYDLAHVHDPQLLAVSANVARYGAGLPAVLSTHGGFRHTGRLAVAKALHERLFLARALRGYARILASSEPDRAYFSRFSDRVTLAANGVSVARFSAVAAVPRSPLRWIYWGRWSVNKRLEDAIDLACAARAAGFPVELDIHGADVDGVGAMLQARIDRHGAAAAVRLRGPIDDAALIDALGAYGVFVTASAYEGFGLGVVEAMAAGLAILCRDIAPLDTVVEDGRNGYRLRFGGGEEDRAMLGDLLGAPGPFAQMAAHNRADAQRFAWDRAFLPFASSYRDAAR